MTQQNTSPGDLLKFLEDFKLSIKTKLGDTKTSIELTNSKIDARMNRLDEDVNSLKEKLNENEEKIKNTAVRMDRRLTQLENEMKKSEKLRRQSDNLREINKDLTNDSTNQTISSSILRLDTEPTNTDKPTINQRTQSEKVNKVTNEILEEPVGTFRSTWARNIQAELEKAAKLANGISDKHDSNRRQEEMPYRRSNEQTNERVKVPINWEDDLEVETTEPTERPSLLDLQMKSKTPKTRKPPTPITDWFGLDTTDTSDTDFEQTSWTSIDRKKIQEDRRRRRHKRNENLKTQCSTRASSMVSMGPIPLESITYFMTNGATFEQAKILAIKELLGYSLNLDDTETESLNIMETKLSHKGDDIMNVAFETENEVKELYIRKAELQNSNLTLRNYIPPNFYARFMHLNQLCTQKRSEDPTLRTQLRFGRKDIEIYTKNKTEDTGFRKVKIEDFTDTEVPKFNPDIKWKKYTDKLPRKIPNLQADIRARPSLAGLNLPSRTQGHRFNTSKDTNNTVRTEGQLIRANSNSLVSQTKRKCLRSQSSEDEDDRMSSSQSGLESDMESFETPAAEVL